MLSASTKDIPLVGTGGLGEYMSESMAGIIRYELAQLPQGASNFALKRFSLGKKPPLVKAIRVTSKREDVCLPSNYHYSDSGQKGGDCVHLILDFDFVYVGGFDLQGLPWLFLYWTALLRMRLSIIFP